MPRKSNFGRERGSKTSNLSNIGLDKTLYLGHDAQTDRVVFTRGGLGYHLYSRRVGQWLDMGPAPTLALGLTECCVHAGRGKVFYLCKDRFPDIERDASKRAGAYPMSYLQLPELLYVDFRWDEQNTKEWLATPHIQRMRFLSARGNALHLSVPSMPITMHFEYDNYDNIRMIKGDGSVYLYTNMSGNMYLGYANEMSAIMVMPAVPAERQFWQGSKAALVNYRVQSGSDAINRLHSMYRRQQPGSIWLYKDVVSNIIAAHQDWVDLGGCSVESIKTLGPEIAAKVRVLRDGTDAPAPPQRLQELRNETNDWPESVRTTKLAYDTAAAEGVTAVSLFMVEDQGWDGLNRDQKHDIIEMWQLEQQAIQRIAEIQEAMRPLAQNQARPRISNARSAAVDTPGSRPGPSSGATAQPTQSGGGEDSGEEFEADQDSDSGSDHRGSRTGRRGSGTRRPRGRGRGGGVAGSVGTAPRGQGPRGRASRGTRGRGAAT